MSREVVRGAHRPAPVALTGQEASAIVYTAAFMAIDEAEHLASMRASASPADLGATSTRCARISRGRLRNGAKVANNASSNVA